MTQILCKCSKSFVGDCSCGIRGIPNITTMHIDPNTPDNMLKQPESTGVKHDQDKPDMSLLSSIALTKVAQVMTFGKKKYSAHNWRGGFAWSRPLAAAARHLYAYIGGEDKDPETGLSHLAHACCCLFFILEFEDTRPDLDDRYKQEVKK